MKKVYIVVENAWVQERGPDETKDLEYVFRADMHNLVCFPTRDAAKAYAERRFAYAVDWDIVGLELEDGK